MAGQSDPEGSPADPKDAKDKEPPKSMGKIVRVMTVFAYLSSVSMAGVLLSIYYLCIWKSPALSDLDANVNHQQGGESFDYQLGLNNDSVLYNITGGGSTTINDNEVQLPSSSVTYPNNQESSEVINATVTEPTSQFNSTVHFNSTTETTDNSRLIAKSTLVI